MTPPKVCPHPGPWRPGIDCPLYAQRLDYRADEPLRRAILTERARPSFGSLVWADFNREYRRPATSPATCPASPRPVLPPAPEPVPILDHLKQKGARS